MGTYGDRRVGGRKSFSGKAESKSFSLGLFCIMNIDLVVHKGISLRKLATISKSLRFI